MLLVYRTTRNTTAPPVCHIKGGGNTVSLFCLHFNPRGHLGTCESSIRMTWTRLMGYFQSSIVEGFMSITSPCHCYIPVLPPEYYFEVSLYMCTSASGSYQSHNYSRGCNQRSTTDLLPVEVHFLSKNITKMFPWCSSGARVVEKGKVFFSFYVEVQTGISTQYYVADGVYNTLYPHARP